MSQALLSEMFELSSRNGDSSDNGSRNVRPEPLTDILGLATLRVTGRAPLKLILLVGRRRLQQPVLVADPINTHVQQPVVCSRSQVGRKQRSRL